MVYKITHPLWEPGRVNHVRQAFLERASHDPSGVEDTIGCLEEGFSVKRKDKLRRCSKTELIKGLLKVRMQAR